MKHSRKTKTGQDSTAVALFPLKLCAEVEQFVVNQIRYKPPELVIAQCPSGSVFSRGEAGGITAATTLRAAREMLGVIHDLEYRVVNPLLTRRQQELKTNKTCAVGGSKTGPSVLYRATASPLRPGAARTLARRLGCVVLRFFFVAIHRLLILLIALRQ